jgi:hypothetical protein
MDGIGRARLKMESRTCGNEFQTMSILEATPQKRCPKIIKGIARLVYSLTGQILNLFSKSY